jgi:hypothetical protein
MKHFMLVPSVGLLFALGACMETPQVTSASDTCGASQYQNLVGGPSKAASALNVPGNTRHYGNEEIVATDNAARLNFVHSGTAFDAVVDPSSTVTQVFCG